MHENWWGWLAVVIIFAIVQAWRALVRSTRANDGSMARLNAAADRILKERGASAANPLPRTKPQPAKRNPAVATKPRMPAPLPKASTPAVIRRTGILSGGEEPVIQRRR